MATTHGPQPGDPVLICDTTGRQTPAQIDQAYGQFRFVRGLRFHARDDRTPDGAYRTNQPHIIIRPAA
jgi:hypothetical protein